MRTLLGLLVLTAPLLASAAPYEIGDDLAGESFWTSDPVLFVRKHAESGLEFTSDQRTGAASRLDGGVSYFGIPVYEPRIAFGEAGGITRVELMLFNTGGTEAMQETVEANGSRFRRRRHVGSGRQLPGRVQLCICQISQFKIRVYLFLRLFHDHIRRHADLMKGGTLTYVMRR